MGMRTYNVSPLDTRGKMFSPIKVRTSQQTPMMHSYVSTKSTNFDTNISEGIKHQQKVVDCKNYEMDSRSLALKNYNYRPDFKLKQAIELI